MALAPLAAAKAVNARSTTPFQIILPAYENGLDNDERRLAVEVPNGDDAPKRNLPCTLAFRTNIEKEDEMLFRTKLAAAGLCFTMLSASGAAAQIATVTTDLNVRSGPGPAYGVVSVIPATQGVFILGCTPTMLWCQVSWDGQTGWAYGAYLAYERDGSRVVVAQTAPRVTIPVIQPDVAVEAQTTVGAIEQPADVDVEADVDPPAPVRNFVFEHELDPYLLEGEVVVGSTLPEVVRLTTVPDYEYRVAYVNQRRVLVDPETREVVYVVR